MGGNSNLLIHILLQHVRKTDNRLKIENKIIIIIITKILKKINKRN